MREICLDPLGSATLTWDLCGVYFRPQIVRDDAVHVCLLAVMGKSEVFRILAGSGPAADIY